MCPHSSKTDSTPVSTLTFLTHEHTLTNKQHKQSCFITIHTYM